MNNVHLLFQSISGSKRSVNIILKSFLYKSAHGRQLKFFHALLCQPLFRMGYFFQGKCNGKARAAGVAIFHNDFAVVALNNSIGHTES